MRDPSGKLYAGGQFFTLNSITMNGIAEWDGIAWHPLGNGVGSCRLPPRCTAAGLGASAGVRVCMRITMTSGIEVRTALSESDRARGDDVRHAAFVTVRSVYRPKPSARAWSPTGEPLRLLAWSGSEAVGMLDAEFASDACHIGNVAVLQAWRRRGVLRRLIKALAEICIERGIGAVRASTIRETGNDRIYIAVGFVPEVERVATWCESDIHPVLHEIDLILRLDGF